MPYEIAVGGINVYDWPVLVGHFEKRRIAICEAGKILGRTDHFDLQAF